jgi:hypothetical protein
MKTKKLLVTALFIAIIMSSLSIAQTPEGIWRMAPQAGAFGVGPAQGDVSFFSNTGDDVVTRACFFDDRYVFNADGSFTNELGTETWIELWQGGSDACGAPVAPHDGSNPAQWSYNATAGTVTLTGVGAYLGIPKAVNGMELTSPGAAPASVTYLVTVINDNTMTLDIDVSSDGSLWWRFILNKVTNSTPEGTWRMAPQAAAFGVGPAQGDISFFSNSLEDVTTRACFFDDRYVFNADGSFQNELGADTWIEPWQLAGTEACLAPIAPHNGSNPAQWSFDANAGTVTLTGVGAYLGIPKAVNGMELTSPGAAPASVTYLVTQIDENTMTLDIDVSSDGSLWWRFIMNKVSTATPDGTWKMAPQAGAFGVGPAQGDVSFFSNSIEDVTTRACFFDDEYVFNSDGSFTNLVGSETWIEAWQGGSDACGAPVAPHDGSNPAQWSYNANASTITLAGVGAYLGIPKAVNGSELASPNDAPASVTYLVSQISDTKMTLDIDVSSDGSLWWRFIMEKQSTTDVEENNGAIPTAYSLDQNYPNPFNPTTIIKFSIPKPSNVKLTIYNLLGQEVTTLLNDFVNAGSYEFNFDASNLSSGTYFYSMTAGSYHSVKKMLLIK